MTTLRTSFAIPFTALAVLLGAAVLAACGGSGDGSTDSGRSPSPSPDPVVLLVDDLPVRQSVIDALRAEFRLGGTSDTEARAEKKPYDGSCLAAQAARLDIEPDASEVDSRRAAMAGQLGGEAALRTALEGVPMSEAQLRRGLEDGILREQVQDARFPDLTATRREAREYYDGHREAFRQAAAINLGLIQVAAERIAESALGRLRDGRPFEEVARQFSTDPEAKAQGGDAGWVLPVPSPAPLRKAAAATAVGETAGRIASPGGWFLLKVITRKPETITPFATSRLDRQGDHAAEAFQGAGGLAGRRLRKGDGLEVRPPVVPVRLLYSRRQRLPGGSSCATRSSCSPPWPCSTWSGGALNNGVVFDVDYVAGTATSVSLLGAAVIAVLAFVVGLIAAYLARTAVFGQRRKLEAELQTTYERLREAESLAVRPTPAPEVDTVVAPAVAAAAEEAAAGEATVVAPGEEAATIVDDGEAATAVAGEAVTAVAGATADADVGEAEAEATVKAPALTRPARRPR